MSHTPYHWPLLVKADEAATDLLVKRLWNFDPEVCSDVTVKHVHQNSDLGKRDNIVVIVVTRFAEAYERFIAWVANLPGVYDYQRCPSPG